MFVWKGKEREETFLEGKPRSGLDFEGTQTLMVVGVFFLNLCVCATYSPGMHHAWIHRGSGRLGHHDAAAASMLASQPKVGHAWRAHALMKDGSLVAKRIACPLSLPGPGKRRLHAKATLRAATASHLLSFPCMTHNASTRNIQKKKKYNLSNK